MIFNENQLRKIIREKIELEFYKYRRELDLIWKYLTKLREEIKVLETTFSIKRER